MSKGKNYIKNNLALVAFLLFATSIGTYSFFNTNQNETYTTEKVALKKSNETVYPSQYSDKNITSNAIIAEPRFESFAMFDRNALLANTVSAISKNTSTTVHSGPENGTWLWTPILDITPKYRNSIISGAKNNGITNIYLSIDSYLDIYVMKNGSKKDELRKKFDEIVRTFIAEANKNGITVDAEGGWRNWAEKGHSYKAFAVLNYAIEFNKNHKEKFRGFQYDIEPYLLDSYKKNKKQVLSNFLDLVGETVKRLNNTDLQFTVVIPEFYDGATGETPSFSYFGKNGFALEHLLSILDRRDQSKIIIMSYRNFSKGDDGSIDISEDEIQKANGHKTKVIIAQETGDVPPPYITFHNTSRKYYKKQVSIIQKAFAKEKSYGGIATHYVNAFLELK